MMRTRLFTAFLLATALLTLASPSEATCRASALDLRDSSRDLAATICAQLDSPEIEEIRITSQTITISFTREHAQNMQLVNRMAKGRVGTFVQQLNARRLVADSAAVYGEVRRLGGVLFLLGGGNVRLMTDRTTWLMTINADGTYTTPDR